MTGTNIPLQAVIKKLSEQIKDSRWGIVKIVSFWRTCVLFSKNIRFWRMYDLKTYGVLQNTFRNRQRKRQVLNIIINNDTKYEAKSLRSKQNINPQLEPSLPDESFISDIKYFRLLWVTFTQNWKTTKF